jgi:2-dehydropantoate 2-reductase
LRLADIRKHGLVIEEFGTGIRSVADVSITEQLAPEDHYDLALITVRRDQLSVILPVLAANHNIPTILFLLNNPSGLSGLGATLARERILLGFPGAGGTLDGPIVRYTMISQQPTTLGELNGKRTARLGAVAVTLRQSGFRVRLENDMDAWLCSHAFFVTSICGAIYLAAGDCQPLSRSPRLLKLMVAGVREGFHTIASLGKQIRPFPIKVLFTWLPRSFAVQYWRCFFAGEMAEFVFGAHARRAFVEMQALAADCQLLLKKTGTSAPALGELYEAIESYAHERRGETI